MKLFFSRLLPVALLILACALPVSQAAETPVFDEATWTSVDKNGLTRQQQAMALEQAGSFKAAAKQYKKMFNDATSPAALAWSLDRQAACWVKADKAFAAKDAYSDLADSYWLYLPNKQDALANMRLISSQMASGEASWFGFKNVSSAVEVYTKLLKVAPAGPDAPQDLMTLAGYQTQLNNGAEAIITYRKIVRQFPQSPLAPQACLDCAKQILYEARTGDGDGMLHRQARQELERLQRSYPTADPAILAEAGQMQTDISNWLAKRLYDLGTFYLRKLSYRPNTARRYFYDVTRLYPTSPSVQMAETQIGRIEASAAAAAAGRDGAAPEPELPPQPVKMLEPQPKDYMEKFLLPLEDYSDYLPSHAKPEPTPEPTAAPTP